VEGMCSGKGGGGCRGKGGGGCVQGRCVEGGVEEAG
jgi:hypothetical protein